MIHVGANVTSGRVRAVAVKANMFTAMGIIVTVPAEAKLEDPQLQKCTVQLNRYLVFVFLGDTAW
jgi:magnesium-transporting ATPase (P-type)